MVKRIIVVLLFLIIACVFINMAPKYDLVYKFKNGDLRVVYNDEELTRETSKLPQVAVLLNGEVMLSQDTVDILFDKDLFYEEKYETLITTCNNHRADIEVDSRTMLVDGEERAIKVPALKTTYDYSNDDRYKDKTDVKEVIYLPIKELQDVYNIDVEFKDIIVITDRTKERRRYSVGYDEVIELKATTDENAKTIEKIEAGKTFEVFNLNDDKEFVKIRSNTGEIGYAKVQDFANMQYFDMAEEEWKPEYLTENIRLAWDYINPDSNGIGNKSSRRKIDELDIVSPTILFLQNTDGEVSYKIKTAEEYMTWAKSTGYDVWVVFKNESNSIKETSEFLNDMNHRNTAIKELISFAHRYDVKGINIDFENMYKEDAKVFSQFIRELAVQTRRNGLVLSVDVNVPDGSDTWSLCYEHKALSEAADYIAVMTYDEFGASSKTPGPNAAYNWVETNIDKLVNREKLEPSKVLLGIAFYSRLWTNNSGKYVSNSINMDKAKSYISKASWDEDARQYYYEDSGKKNMLWSEDKTSINEKLKLIDKYKLGGFACWRLGFESDDVWEAFSE